MVVGAGAPSAISGAASVCTPGDTSAPNRIPSPRQTATTAPPRPTRGHHGFRPAGGRAAPVRAPGDVGGPGDPGDQGGDPGGASASRTSGSDESTAVPQFRQ